MSLILLNLLLITYPFCRKKSPINKFYMKVISRPLLNITFLACCLLKVLRLIFKWSCQPSKCARFRMKILFAGISSECDHLIITIGGVGLFNYYYWRCRILWFTVFITISGGRAQIIDLYASNLLALEIMWVLFICINWWILLTIAPVSSFKLTLKSIHAVFLWSFCYSSENCNQFIFISIEGRYENFYSITYHCTISSRSTIKDTKFKRACST